LEGIASGVLFATLPVLAVESVGQANRGPAIGIIRTFFAAGGLLGPMFIISVSSMIGAANSFIVTAVIIFATIPIVLTLKETRRHRE